MSLILNGIFEEVCNNKEGLNDERVIVLTIWGRYTSCRVMMREKCE